MMLMTANLLRECFKIKKKAAGRRSSWGIKLSISLYKLQQFFCWGYFIYYLFTRLSLHQKIRISYSWNIGLRQQS